MRYQLELILDDTFFIESLRNIKSEDLEFIDNKIVIKDNSVSKLRAKANLILRLLKIYENFKEFLKNNEING